MADTNVTLGFVHSLKFGEALEDSATHTGKIYFPKDSTSIIKDGKMYSPQMVDIYDPTTESGVKETLESTFATVFFHNGDPVNFIQTLAAVEDLGLEDYHGSGATDITVFVVPSGYATKYHVYGTAHCDYLKTFTHEDVPEVILRAIGIPDNIRAYTDGIPFSFASGTDTKHTILSNVMLSSVSRVIFEITNNVSDIGVGVGDDGSNAKSVMAAGIYEYTPSEYHLYQGKYNINVWGTEAIEGKIYIR